MAIERNKLVIAINESLNRGDYDTYIKLLDIYYNLLEQEDINDRYLSEFISYDNIPESIYKLIAQSV